MKEQQGVPLFPGEAIRFNQPRAATTTAPSGRQAPASRSRDILRATRSQRPPVFADADYGEEESRHARSPTTVRRLDRNPLETRVLPRRRFDAGRWLIVTGLALLVMLLGFMALSWLGAWWQTQTNDWAYGRPRTFQVDHIVGHQDSPRHPSHFLALNLNRQVLMIELPGGDPSKAIMYTGPTLVGDGQDLTPVTLTFVDVNGDGKPDMEIHILDQVIVFRNTGTKFVPSSPQP
jgi:hypothetical protein